MAESIDIRELNVRIEQQSAFVTNLVTGMNRVIVGQKHLIDSLLISLLSDGHILLEGVPGLAKTLAIKTLAQLIDADYSRIQFTPDLLPADVIGTLIYSQKDNNFQVKKGPVFANFVLADEINRAPAKVQSALLEAMQEHQVTIGDNPYLLPTPFLVMAPQNPIEQEGTYQLPEAQVDRFMLKVIIDYPTNEEEKLKEAIVNDIKRGITILDGRGGYTDSSKSVLIVAVNKKQEVHMKKLIKNVDKNAFIIVSKAHEVFGEGFSPISA